MELIEIVKNYLKTKEYDGLYNIDGECACSLDDLMPCCEPAMHCAAGYLVPCDCGEHDFHIQQEKLGEDDFPVGEDEFSIQEEKGDEL